MATFSFNDVVLDEGDFGVVWVEGVGFRPMDPTEEFCGQIIGENECTSGSCNGKYNSKAIFEDYDLETIEPFVTPNSYMIHKPWSSSTTHSSEFPPAVDAPLSLVLMLSAFAAFTIIKSIMRR